MVWYWPRGLKAIGHISHDSDGNDPAKATALLEVMNGCQVKSTWCMLYPGGYPREFYRTLQDQAFEVALHYDAHTGGPQTCWSKENFLLPSETAVRFVKAHQHAPVAAVLGIARLPIVRPDQHLAARHDWRRVALGTQFGAPSYVFACLGTEAVGQSRFGRNHIPGISLAPLRLVVGRGRPGACGNEQRDCEPCCK